MRPTGRRVLADGPAQAKARPTRWSTGLPASAED